jgi:MoxR-like ATPase
VLEEPFFVIATQNPIEQEGTYPLPEAQLDRFMFNIKIGYPSTEEEIEVVQRTTSGAPSRLERVLTARQVLDIQQIVRKVPASEAVVRYAVEFVSATRPGHPKAPDFVRRYIRWGAGPRASQYLILGGKARSLLRGEYCVDYSDVRAIAHEVLSHRIVTNFQAEADGVKPDDLVDRLLEAVPPQP